MTSLPSSLPPEPPECEDAFERMPWMVNGSLAPTDAAELEAHVAQCPRCRVRLDTERDLFRAIRRPLDNVEQSPLAAWGRFESTLAGFAAEAGAGAAVVQPAESAAATSRSPAPLARHRASARGRLRLTLLLQAASIAALSVAVLWLLLTRSGPAPTSYRTVSSADPAIATGSGGWRVTFDDATGATLARELLARHGLRVLDGPGRDNVYTVATVAAPVEELAAPQAQEAAEAAIAALRADPRVRLLEPLAAPGTAP